MTKLAHLFLPRAVSIFLILIAALTCASAQTKYVIANDDVPFPFLTGVSFFSVGASGALTLKQQVLTGGHGGAAGYFGANRIAVLNASDQHCVYAPETYNGDIAGIDVDTLLLTSNTAGSSTDAGTSNGIGLALSTDYLYASFTDSNTIGTFKIESGCSLMFVNDTAVTGSQGGFINAMAVHGNMMVVTYTDGSIESFDLSTGPPLSHGDKQLSSATVTSQYATYPNKIDITSDGKYAIFGDTSTAAVIEVSNISSGKLTKTLAYQTSKSISSSNIILSPDETILYVVNTQGDSVSAYFFNKSTGAVTFGCQSNKIKGQSVGWSYLVGAALVSQTGNGGGLYVAEFGGTSGVSMVKFGMSGGTCTLQEMAGSPFIDGNSTALLSIGTYPPRAF